MSPHFGWTIPSSKNDGSFDIQVEKQSLAVDALNEFQRAAEFFAAVRPTLIDFLILENEFAEVLKLPQALRALFLAEAMPLQNTGALIIRMHVMADRALNSFLAAAAMFRDRLLHRQGIKKGSTHPIKTFLHNSYDASFAYRLCYNLRNFGQHTEAILNIIPVIGKDLQAQANIEIELSLRRDRLIAEMKKAQPRLLEELSREDERIPFLPLAQEYHSILRDLFGQFLLLKMEDVQFVTGMAKALRAGARDMPTGAIPTIFTDPPNPEGPVDSTGRREFTSKVEHISLDELEILERIFPQLTAR